LYHFLPGKVQAASSSCSTDPEETGDHKLCPRESYAKKGERKKNEENSRKSDKCHKTRHITFLGAQGQGKSAPQRKALFGCSVFLGYNVTAIERRLQIGFQSEMGRCSTYSHIAVAIWSLNIWHTIDTSATDD